jgi:uncharacterized protein YndB with AHSA1/START domain
MGAGGEFWDVVAAERLVYTEVFDEAWYTGECIVTVTFENDGDGTRATMSMRYESQAARDMAISSHAADGVTEGYERLAALLAETQAS